jgi:hypothetical protein
MRATKIRIQVHLHTEREGIDLLRELLNLEFLEVDIARLVSKNHEGIKSALRARTIGVAVLANPG